MTSFITLIFGFVFAGICIGFFVTVNRYIDSNRKDRTRDIVGHEPAKNTLTETKEAVALPKQRKKSVVALNMATPKLELAFAELPDWSEYDQPTYLRKKLNPKAVEETNSNAKTDEPAKRKAVSKKTRMTPQEQLEEFKKNSKGRFSDANYETI